MYDELVKALRETDFGDVCVLCESELCRDKDCVILQAADAIEELMRRCEQFQYMPPPAWIPVTERLPKEGEFVLVYGDLYPNKHDGGVIAVSKRMDWNYWQGFGRERNITHWMPLPTPPTAEEGKA